MKKILPVLLLALGSSLFTYCGAQYQYINLHDFRSSYGGWPLGSLIRGGNVLYGMTSRGGAHNDGCIYSLDITGANYTDLIDFDYGNPPVGGTPIGALLLSGNKLFGMTNIGAAHAQGNIFSVNTDGTNYKDLIDFNGIYAPKGANPYGTLIISGSTLYGLSYTGGLSGYGCIFSLDTSGSGYTDLFDFSGTADGKYPNGSLILSGNELFGMASSGGANGDGVIFSIHTDGTGFKNLLNFSHSTGESPLGSLIISGKTLYGMTYQGGISYRGNVFSIDTLGNNYKDMHDFIYNDGDYPAYSQLSILGGTLYGLVPGGAAYNSGSLFSIDTGSSTFTRLYSFNSPTGGSPESSLLLSGNRMYGTTRFGGLADSGVVFSFRTCSLTTSMFTTDISCCGDSNGSATVTASSGILPYTYSWSTNPVQTNAQATGLQAGTYTVSVYDSGGCYTSVSVTITQPACLQDSILGSPSLGCNCNGTIEVFAYGGTQPYTYLWSTGGTYDTVHNLRAGEYYVTVCDAHGCCIHDSFGVMAGDPVYTSQINDKCYGDCNGSISISTWGWNGFLWSPGGQTTASISGLCAGSYSVLITNLDTACTATYSFTIIQPPPFTATVSLNSNVLCYGESDGSASVNPGGGTMPYTYSWNDGETNATATALPAGLASVVVTDKNGCSASGSVTLTQPAAPLMAYATTFQTNCSPYANFLINANGGTPPYTYDWPPGVSASGNTGQLYASCSNYVFNPFGVTVYDANGCSYFVSVGFNQPVQFNYVTPGNVSCYGGNNGAITVQLCSSNFGTFQYTISPGGTYSSNAQPYTYTNLTAGTYTISVQDPFGCNTGPYTVTLTQPPAIVVTTTVTAAICSTPGSATASVASGGVSPFTYSWSPPGGTNVTASNLSTGTYTITVTDNNGCAGSATAIISDSSLNVSTIVTSNISCYGGSDGSASSTISGGTTPYTYSWSNSQTTINISGLSIGTYTLNVTDASNCSGTAAVTITEPTQLVGSYSFSGFYNASNICQDTGCVQVLPQASGGTPPYTFGGFYNGFQCYSNVNFLSVTDANGCTDSYTENLLMGLSIRVQINNNVSCYGGNNGSAIVNEQTGALFASSLNYSWSPGGGSTQTVSNLSAGSYTVTVTDPASSCSVHEVFVITQPAPLVITGDSTNDNGTCNGSAWANVSGGVNPYTYSWTGGGINDTIRSKCFGNYCCTVTDANGCLDSICVTINLTTGVNQLTVGSEQWIVYPNPNNGKFTIESSMANGQWSVEIYNVLGQKVFSQVNIHKSTFTIDLSNKANGVYFYRVIKEDGTVLGEGKLVIDK
ncbi:MAG TPA: choice-of-anchor tandem repeat GloVer-containing protein [Bacteroidia bacterium]|nr:choice-of-anchor tandem repeat GloVer-containing protein [Bacteroidia bacterium]